MMKVFDAILSKASLKTSLRTSPESRSFLDESLFILLFLYLSTFVFEAPIRYALALIHLENILYVRDLIYVFSILSLLFRSLLIQRSFDLPIITLLGVLTFHFIIGLLSDAPLFPQLLSIKIFLPFVYGCALWPIISTRFKKFLVLLSILSLVSAIGILIHKVFGRFVWENKTYQTAFGVTQTSREWWTGGLRRLSGFQRTSFDAATILGIGGFSALMVVESNWRRLLIISIALTCIYWTTTKGMLFAFFLLSFWCCIPNSKTRLSSGRMLVTILFLLSILLPTTVVLYEIGDPGRLNDAPFLLSSLWDRFSTMWPSAIELFSEPLHFIIGRGLGTIGTPQIFGPTFYQVNAADNIFVYSYMTFGLFSLIYLFFPVWCMWTQQPKTGNAVQQYIWYIGILIIGFGYGLTTSMFEEVFFCVTFGICYGAIFAPSNTAANKSGM